MDLHSIEGKWHIYATNFPMWLKGDKTNPTFNYGIEKYREGYRLLDVVSYIQKEKKKMIRGYDLPINKENTAFEWSGKGLLRFIKSKWKIIHISIEQQWMVIFFEKTIFTPRGFDIITRDKDPSEKIRQEIEDYLMKNQHFPPLKTLI